MINKQPSTHSAPTNPAPSPHQLGSIAGENDPIEPLAFTPASTTGTKAKLGLIPITPLMISLSSLLLIGGLILWFLFTAKSVVFNITPHPDNYQIDGIHWQWDNYYLLRPGTYQLTAELKGYYPLAQTLNVDEQQHQIKTYIFEKLPGSLTIHIPNGPAQSSAFSASIALDQQLVGRSGEQIQDIKAGKYQLSVDSPWHLPYEDSLEIQGMLHHQQLHLELQPAWAEVTLNSIPEGAQIYNDQQELLGTTPFQGPLLAGKHQLKMQLAGYQTSFQQLQISADQNISIDPISLIPLDAELQLSTQPSQVSVTLNGKYQGLTPLTLSLPAATTQQLSLFKDGYQAYHHSINLASGHQESLNLVLSPLLGEVTIKASEPDALLYIDDRLMGRANQSVTLTVKQHQIVIKKAGFVDHQATVLPSATLQQRLDVQLKTLEQAKWENTPQLIETQVGATLKLFRPQGVFTMGASRREQGRRANEVKRRIRLQRPFYLGTHEITNQQFRRFARQHSSGHVKGNSLNNNQHPVVNISWTQAALFCNWLSEQHQLTAFYQLEAQKIIGINPHSNGYRLPTEAEWAWAARYHAGKMLKYSWGNSLPPAANAGNFADRSGAPILGFIQAKYQDNFIVTAPVASFPPDAKGLYDLSGNVAEWINDFYAISTGLSAKIEEDPLGAEQGDHHVIRGSSWAHGTMTALRLSYRDYGMEPRNDVGFRIARFVESQQLSDQAPNETTHTVDQNQPLHHNSE